MTIVVRFLSTLLALLGLSVAAQSQTQAVPDLGALLIADEVYITGDQKLVAEGNVEAMFNGQRLQARSITYDQKTETLKITGPIVLDALLAMAGTDEPRKARRSLTSYASYSFFSTIRRRSGLSWAPS